MNILRKNFLAVFLLSSALAGFSACDRVDMYEYATGKHPLIYAVTDTDDLLNTAIIKANNEGYLDIVNTAVPAGFAALIEADRQGNIFLFDGATGTYIINENGNTVYAVSPITVTGTASNDKGTFIFSGSSYDVYTYSSSSSWVLYKTIMVADYPVTVSMDIDDGIIYFMASVSGNAYIYELESEIRPIPGFNIGPGGYWFEVNNKSFYVGKTNVTNLYLNGTFMGSASPIASTYAATDDGSVFAAVHDGTLSIYIFDGSTFVPVYHFSSTSGTMKLAGIKKGELAIGLDGTDMAEDGLYIYEYRKNKMTRLSSKPVYHLIVR